VHLRLLQHDLGDEDVIRVVGSSPRQIAAMAAVPGPEGLGGTAEGRGRGCRRSVCAGGSVEGLEARVRVVPQESGGASVASSSSRIIFERTHPVKLYTRTGDAGETALFDNSRVSKADPRVDAYGEVDELNAWLGLVRSAGVDPDIDADLIR